MSGWLPPGCTDKDIDDAAPREAETYEDYMDMRREAIWLERTLHDIRVGCEELSGKGYQKELRELLAEILIEHGLVTMQMEAAE